MSVQKPIALTPELAPALFSTGHAGSSQYVQFPGLSIVPRIVEAGWAPVRYDAHRTNRRDDESEESFSDRVKQQKHTVRFVPSDDLYRPAVVGERCSYLEWTNSHSARHASTFATGILEYVCSNGMCLPVSQSGVRIAHKNVKLENVLTVLEALLTQFPAFEEIVSILSAFSLTVNQRKDFAARAALIRWSPEDGEEIKTEQLLMPQFAAQRKVDAWSVANTVQRNLLTGSFDLDQRPINVRRTTTEEKDGVNTQNVTIRKAKEITGPDVERDFTSQLMDLTLAVARDEWSLDLPTFTPPALTFGEKAEKPKAGPRTLIEVSDEMLKF